MTNQLNFDELEFLKAVDAKIAQVLSQSDALLDGASQLLRDVASHLCLNGSSKRARPLLTLYFGQALDIPSSKLVEAAAASELLHSASLLHDDVVDNAQLRRGIPTANVQWSNSTAVLSGNYLLCLAFDLLTNYPISLTRDGVRVVRDMTKAAIAEIEIRNKDFVELKTWREIAIGKTGALFGMCGLASARIKNDDYLASQIVKCANSIGIIFQMTDDVIDITDSSGLKDRYSDIVNKELSFPLILATEDKLFQKQISNAFGLEVIPHQLAQEIGENLVQAGVIVRAKKLITNEINAAIDYLGPLSNTTGGQRITEWLNTLEQKF